MNYVLYHSNCPDGFGAAFAMWLGFGNSDGVYKAVSYGKPFPEDIKKLLTEDDRVYIVDFSYPTDVLKEINTICPTIILDHHAGAEEQLKNSGCQYVFDNNRSGAVIAFDWVAAQKLYSSSNRLFFEYVQDRDLWLWKMPSSKALSAWLMSFPYDFSIWYNLLLMFFNNRGTCISEGEAILRFKAKELSMICDGAYKAKLDDLDVVAVNATSQWSEVGEELLKRYPNENIAVSYWKRNDNVYQFSIRTRSGTNAIDIAKKFGGGGHAQAAGFTSDKNIL